MIRPGDLITAFTLAGWGLCVAGLIVLRRLDRVDLGRITTN